MNFWNTFSMQEFQIYLYYNIFLFPTNFLKYPNKINPPVINVILENVKAWRKQLTESAFPPFYRFDITIIFNYLSSNSAKIKKAKFPPSIQMES